MREKISFLAYILTHPFDGFYDAKYRGKGSSLLSIILIAVFCVLPCITYQYMGFIMNFNEIQYMNSLTIIISNLSIVVLFIVANYTVTTLFDGKGAMKDITMVLAYSFVPMIITNIILIIGSNFIIAEEVVLLNTVHILGTAWTVFLLLCGLCVIHEYRFLQNIITLIATLIAAAIIIFLFVLFISLVEQLVGFVMTIFSESLRRI